MVFLAGLSQFSRYLTLASEVVFLKMPSRNQKKRSIQRAEYLQKREDILSQENKAKARARYKADPEKKKASVRDTYNANAVSKRAAKRQRTAVTYVQLGFAIRSMYHIYGIYKIWRTLC